MATKVRLKSADGTILHPETDWSVVQNKPLIEKAGPSRGIWYTGGTADNPVGNYITLNGNTLEGITISNGEYDTLGKININNNGVIRLTGTKLYCNSREIYYNNILMGGMWKHVTNISASGVNPGSTNVGGALTLSNIFKNYSSNTLYMLIPESSNSLIKETSGSYWTGGSSTIIFICGAGDSVLAVKDVTTTHSFTGNSYVNGYGVYSFEKI